MKRFKTMVLAAMAVGFLAGPTMAQTHDLKLGTSSAGGSWYPAAQVMAKIIQEEVPDTRVTVMPGGSLSNVKGVSAGTYDLAFAHSQDIAVGMAGEAPFKEKIENVRGVLSLWTNYLQIGARPEMSVNSIGELKGMSIAPGNRGWGGEAAARLILSLHDLGYEDMKKVEFTKWRGMIDLYKDHHVDAVFAVSTANLPAFQEMAVSGSGLKLISLDKPTIEKAVKQNPGYFAAAMPAGTYEGQDAAIDTLGSNTILFTRSDLPEDLVKKMTKALLDRRQELVSALAALSEMTPEFAARIPAVPLHPGAKAYYAEQGILK